MPVIHPAPGQGPALARTLLAMASHPRDVKVTSDGGFEVPAEVEQLWLESLAPVVSEPAEDPHGPAAPPRAAPARKPLKHSKSRDVELPEE